MSVTVTRKDKAWLKKLREANKGKEVLAVGYPINTSGSSLRYPDGTPVILVAAANNFGARIPRGDAVINIPRRDFMGPGGKLAVENTRAITKVMVPKINAGKATKADALKVMGPVAVSAFQTAIEQLKTPPNAPSTIANKKSDNPLEDTGLMKNTLTFAIREG